MSLRKSSIDWPAGAVWNFPSGERGHLKLRIMLQKDFGGALLGLTDHFSVPFDNLDVFYNMFNLKIEKGGNIEGCSTVLSPGRWYDLVLNWDCEKGYCQVIVNDVPVKTLYILHRKPDASYLRLRPKSIVPDQGMLIESVEVRVDN